MIKLSLENTTKKYVIKGRPVTAIEDVSLTVEAGTFTALVGSSGSGKSTILHLISGIEQPSSGKIIIDDQDIAQLTSQQLSEFRQKKIGIIFQQFYLDPTLTLKQNIELPAMFSKLPLKQRHQRTLELATIMGLGDHLNHRPSELSGGQIQRAAIARALYNNPSILIADEPTSNLDSENMLKVIQIFKHIQNTFNTTIIVATHDEKFAHFADQIIDTKGARVSA